MSNKILVFDKDEFIQRFVDKFSNALLRMPVLIEDNNCIILNDELKFTVNGEEFSYKLNFLQTVEKNIFEIRKDMSDRVFPIVAFSHKREESLSTKEINELLSKGVSLEEALSRTKEIVEKEIFVINRINITKDEFFLKNVEDETDERMYKLKTMPVSILLKRLRTGKLTPEEAGDLLEDKAIFIKKIYPEREWNKILNKK